MDTNLISMGNEYTSLYTTTCFKLPTLQDAIESNDFAYYVDNH